MRQKTYSVAEARSDLPGIVRRAERGRPARITRRGKPVAAIVSIDEYERLTEAKPTFAELYAAWRKSVDRGDLVGPAYFAGLRDRSPGRDVKI